MGGAWGVKGWHCCSCGHGEPLGTCGYVGSIEPSGPCFRGCQSSLKKKNLEAAGWSKEVKTKSWFSSFYPTLNIHEQELVQAWNACMSTSVTPPPCFKTLWKTHAFYILGGNRTLHYIECDVNWAKSLTSRDAGYMWSCLAQREDVHQKGLSKTFFFFCLRMLLMLHISLLEVRWFLLHALSRRHFFVQSWSNQFSFSLAIKRHIFFSFLQSKGQPGRLLHRRCWYLSEDCPTGWNSLWKTLFEMGYSWKDG